MTDAGCPREAYIFAKTPDKCCLAPSFLCGWCRRKEAQGPKELSSAWPSERITSERFVRAPQMFRVAHLQNEVCAKDLFRGTNFLTKNAPNFSLIGFSLYLVGPKKKEKKKKQRKIPAKFPAKFPSPKSKKSPTSFCRSAGRTNGGLADGGSSKSEDI